MGNIYNVTHNPASVVAYEITESADMQTVLGYVAGLPAGTYTGMVQCQLQNGVVVWQLLINNSVNNTSAFAIVGDVVVIENETIVSVCKAVDFDNLFTIVGE